MSTRSCSARLLAAGLASLWLTPPERSRARTSASRCPLQDAAAWDIGIQPDGTGLPPGKGKPADGAKIYATKCIACHGADGAGQPNDRLVGGQGTLTQLAQVRTLGSYWPYATTVFDYIRRAMPFQQPESLTNDEVYALTAFLLAKNGIIRERDEMNARTLAKVRMPNRDGFIIMYPPRADGAP